MIELLDQFLDLLARDSIRTKEVADGVGGVLADPGIPSAIRIAPFSPKLRTATLARYRESALPFLLTLEPTPQCRPLLSTLTAAFGDCRRTLTGRGLPPTCIIEHARAGTDCTIAMIVTLSDIGAPSADPVATFVALRRDHLLPDAPSGT